MNLIEVVLAVVLVLAIIILYRFKPRRGRHRESNYHDPKTHYYKTMGTSKPPVPREQGRPTSNRTDTRMLPKIVPGRHREEDY